MSSVNGKTLLVTGGTGSFGRTMVEHFLKTDIAEIRVFSRDEKKQDDMQQELADARVSYILGDVRDYDSISAAMPGADFVFHAAALKQVPSCERQPLEAIKTNVLGAENVMRAAVEAEVKTCVVLSTDKAVYPVSTMGTTKALMEKLMVARALASPKTVLCATRYGNVMGSRGSVIPRFVNQLMTGKPVTITDPEMTRFLMSLEESVELVLLAFERAQPGDILVQRSATARVIDIAAALAELLGRDMRTQLLGARRGEKATEVLVSADEMARAEEWGLYFRIPAAAAAATYLSVSYNSHTAPRLSRPSLMTVLQALPCVQEALRAV